MVLWRPTGRGVTWGHTFRVVSLAVRRPAGRGVTGGRAFRVVSLAGTCLACRGGCVRLVCWRYTSLAFRGGSWDWPSGAVAAVFAASARRFSAWASAGVKYSPKVTRVGVGTAAVGGIGGAHTCSGSAVTARVDGCGAGKFAAGNGVPARAPGGLAALARGGAPEPLNCVESRC